MGALLDARQGRACDIVASTRAEESHEREHSLGLDPRAWFKNCLPPAYGGSLAVVGWARPHEGGVPQCAELLARYHARLVAGLSTFPADAAEAAAREADAAARYFFVTPGLKTLVERGVCASACSRRARRGMDGAHSPRRASSTSRRRGAPGATS